MRMKLINFLLIVLAFLLGCVDDPVASSDKGDEEPTKNVLISATKSGNIERVREQLNRDAFSQGELDSSLNIALMNKQLSIFHLLLEAGADPNFERGDNNLPIIFFALAADHSEFLKLLLQFGADIDSDLGAYGTPFIVALRGRHFDVAKYLLENGANPLIGHGKNKNVFSYLCENDDWYQPEWKRRKDEIIQIMLSNYADQFTTGCPDQERSTNRHP